MEPVLFTGDLVMVRKQDDYQLGDTILTRVMGGLVIHKIVWISSSSVKTQGINNDYVDTWTLPKSAILGKQSFVFKQLGTYLLELRTNPLTFGLAAAALGGLLQITPRRRSKNLRLNKILASAKHEVPQLKKSYLNKMLVGLYVLALGSLVATGVLLSNSTQFYPRVLLSLSGLVISILAIELVGNWLVSGSDLAEPDRSMAIFGKRLYRISPETQIDGQTKPVLSAQELMALAEVAHVPVLHLVLNEGVRHEFFVVTDELNYLFGVDLAHVATKRGRHKK